MQASMELSPAQVRKRGSGSSRRAILLDVHSQGHTREQAERNLKDALATFLLSCYERGTLEIVLRETFLHTKDLSRRTFSDESQHPHLPAALRPAASPVNELAR